MKSACRSSCRPAALGQRLHNTSSVRPPYTPNCNVVASRGTRCDGNRCQAPVSLARSAYTPIAPSPAIVSFAIRLRNCFDTARF